MLPEYVIAKYIRLSLEDAKSDSLSVFNQRLILDKHIADMDIPGATVLEFVDNGHSGMNFDRPAVQELLELVRQGKVNCIIVKDMSRFGRNMIDTGYYIERVFPLYRIRFISVSDYHDSANFVGDTGGTDIAFKFLVHEQYSRDLSKKIKSARRAKALNGEYIVKNCVFGYKKVGNKLEIDEPAAATVRFIFDMAKDGNSLVEIITRLYDKKHPTPSEYKKSPKQPLEKDFKCLWGKPQILSLLRDEQYIGTYVAGRTKAGEVGRHQAIRVDESEWIRIPNHHPAIIDKAVFDAVGAKIGQKSEPLKKVRVGTWERYRGITSPLKGKVFCGCCNHVMKLSSTRNTAFQCEYTRSAMDAKCHRLRVLASDLESVVMNVILEQSQVILNSASEKPLQAVLLSGYEEQVMQLEDASRALYERFVLGDISMDEYKIQKTILATEYNHAKSAQAVFEKQAENMAAQESFSQIVGNALAKKELSVQLVDALVENVRVYPDRRVDVIWKSSSIGLLMKEVTAYV